jgi:hypothetical protein
MANTLRTKSSHYFCNTGKNGFGLKMVKVLRLALKKDQNQRKNASQAKDYKLACSGSMGRSSKSWSSCFSLISRFLKRKIKLSV